MSKKDNILALAPVAPDLSTGISTSLMPWSSRQGLTAEEKRIVDLSHKQRLVVDAIRTKGIYGVSRIANLHEYTNARFAETAGQIFEVREQPRKNKDLQDCVDQFSGRGVQLLAQHLMATLEVSAEGIGRVMHESPYPPPPEPERPRGLLSRLFG